MDILKTQQILLKYCSKTFYLFTRACITYFSIYVIALDIVIKEVILVI